MKKNMNTQVLLASRIRAVETDLDPRRRPRDDCITVQ
jgi:hypothetical protein